jgi:uncharacterized protein YcbK (DUF882 family)
MTGAAPDLLPSEMFRVRSLAFHYADGAVFVMPHEKVPLVMTAFGSRLFSLEAPQGALTSTGPNKWTWEAPGEKGRYPLEVRFPGSGKVVDFNAFVMVPAADVTNGVLNDYRIGFYPAKPLKGNPAYIAPKGFIEVTKDNEDTKVSPHFRLKQFLTKQTSGYPKYLVLDERLIYLLEAIGTNLEPLGYKADDIVIMSGYRTPFYNKAIGDTEFSMHQWGRASDIFLDKNHDGMMDDINKDKIVDREDAVTLANLLEALAKTERLSTFIGGIGIYAATSAHGPFVHVDTRPWKARW